MGLMIATTGRVLKEVFARPSSWMTALPITVVMLLLTIVLMNYSLLKFISASGAFNTEAKIRIFTTSLGSFRTRISVPEQIITLATALLAGINASVLAHYFKKRIPLQRAMGVSTVGILGSFLGIGCASCGSLLLISLLGLSTAGGFIRLLPLRGMEFGIASILILLFSLFIIARKIESPLVCKK